MSLPNNWGATRAECARHYPADDLVTGSVRQLDRAVTVRASAQHTYRWLCQLSLAPYSYDLLDNRGRRSPRTLVPSAEDLVLGQRMIVFDLVDIQPGRQFTGRCTPQAARLFGAFAISYAVAPAGVDRCRLLCRLVLPDTGPVQRLRGWLLAWGDLVMMRKQLLTLASCAEAPALD